MNGIDNTYKRILWSIEKGMGQTIYMILLEHVGKEQAILGRDLTSKLHYFYSGEKIDDLQRQMREVISDLRKRGYLICSAPGKTGGYWLPKDRKEFDDFIEHELESKIRDLSITKNSLVKAANEQLGKEFQLSLM